MLSLLFDKACDPGQEITYEDLRILEEALFALTAVRSKDVDQVVRILRPPLPIIPTGMFSALDHVISLGLDPYTVKKAKVAKSLLVTAIVAVESMPIPSAPVDWDMDPTTDDVDVIAFFETRNPDMQVHPAYADYLREVLPAERARLVELQSCTWTGEASYVEEARQHIVLIMPRSELLSLISFFPNPFFGDECAAYARLQWTTGHTGWFAGVTTLVGVVYSDRLHRIAEPLRVGDIPRQWVLYLPGSLAHADTDFGNIPGLILDGTHWEPSPPTLPHVRTLISRNNSDLPNCPGLLALTLESSSYPRLVLPPTLKKLHLKSVEALVYTETGVPNVLCNDVSGQLKFGGSGVLLICIACPRLQIDVATLSSVGFYDALPMDPLPDISKTLELRNIEDLSPMFKMKRCLNKLVIRECTSPVAFSRLYSPTIHSKGVISDCTISAELLHALFRRATELECIRVTVLYTEAYRGKYKELEGLACVGSMPSIFPAAAPYLQDLHIFDVAEPLPTLPPLRVLHMRKVAHPQSPMARLYVIDDAETFEAMPTGLYPALKVAIKAGISIEAVHAKFGVVPEIIE